MFSWGPHRLWRALRYCIIRIDRLRASSKVSVHLFYTHDGMHKLSAEYLPGIMAEDGKNVKFAAWFILMELENYLVALLDVIISSKV